MHDPSPQGLLTPAMRDVLDRIQRAARPKFESLSPNQARTAYAAGADVLEIAKPALPRIQDVAWIGRDGAALAARVYGAKSIHAGPLPCLLYMHGGGGVIGSVDTHDTLCRDLAKRCEGLVVSIEYRLAPEHPFPQGFDDACDALAWIVRDAKALGIDPHRLAVGGDSAGGALAAALALHARDNGLPLCLQLLITPHIGTESTPSRERFAHGFLLDATTIAWFFGHALAPDPNRASKDWRFAPGQAELVDEVAPACFILAECDPLFDEAMTYADRLRMAGVQVTLDVAHGVTHEFMRMGRVIPEAATAKQWAADALKRAWSNSPTVKG